MERNETKHTPGPWSWNGRVAMSGAFPVLAESGKFICEVDPAVSGFDLIDGKQPTEQIANARLIAAAPTLLEALRNLSATVDAAILAGDWRIDGACDPDMDIKRARAAIALATSANLKEPQQ
jgi:hypothetical protein